MPPSSTPTAPPLPATAPQIPSARLRSRPSSKVVVRIDSAAGDIMAAPRPCKPRNAISEPSDQASPSSSELTVNRRSPAMNRRRRPNRSASRPPSRRNPPKKIEYAVSTHCRLSCEKCRSVLIDGRATFTIEISSTTMNCAVTITASATQRRRSSVPATGFVRASADISLPWSRRLGRALGWATKQSPAGGGDAEADEDGEDEDGVRRARALVERDSRPDHRHRETNEERDEQLGGHRYAVLGRGPVEHEPRRSF